jgi:hypothetical protein
MSPVILTVDSEYLMDTTILSASLLHSVYSIQSGPELTVTRQPGPPKGCIAFEAGRCPRMEQPRHLHLTFRRASVTNEIH